MEKKKEEEAEMKKNEELKKQLELQEIIIQL